MKNFFFILLFPFVVPKDAMAQYGQSAVLAKMGIVRMVTQKTISSNLPRQTNRIEITETFFDSLGQIVRSINDACSGCGTIFEFDSISGLGIYALNTRPEGFSETFTEYDNKKRRIRTKVCTNDNEACETNVFDYDEDNTERMYKITTRRHLIRDTTGRTKQILGLSSSQVEEKQLVHEKFYSPEGQLEETRNYWDGKFRQSSLYEYDTQGHWIQIWSFDGKNKTLTNECTRNEKGQLIIKKTYIPSSANPLYPVSEPMVDSFEYDENGLLIKMVTGNAVLEYTYFTE